MTRREYLNTLRDRIEQDFTGPLHGLITPDELLAACEVIESLVDAESTRINPWREKGDDDGVEYADPRDALDERRGL